mmetsp:Transcript_45228/g.33005  ORF Transcript_45228/g.33005 Transcript_45228/m.33005 type:complete len:124 (-) Transcript_45228:114-485(-)
MVVNASPSSFGKVLLANSKIHRDLGYQIGQLQKGFNIGSLMPSHLRSIHDRLYAKFNQFNFEALTIATKGINTFVLTSKGYIIYVNIKMEFIRTKMFNTSYLLTFNRLKKFEHPELGGPLRLG